MDLTNLSSNWKKLQATLNHPQASNTPTEARGLKRKRDSQHVSPIHAVRKKTKGGGVHIAARNANSAFRPKSSNSMDAEMEKDSSVAVTVNTGLTSRSGDV